ncbi:MAG: hypothetical protein M1822_005681 [Bathelium mastoideum]|nr:MAG: hypothetical protein M1822_005681 [Bathelium mastoideum]
MKKSFSAKRTPRKIDRDDDDLPAGSRDDAPNAPNSEPVVRRPGLVSKPKKSSSLRLSFGPDAKSTDPSQDESDDVFAPKKSHLSRLARENNARNKTLRTLLSSENLPFRTGTTDDQPSYSASYLTELRDSTPTRPPKDAHRQTDPDLPIPDDQPIHSSTQSTSSQPRALDIAAKFGPTAALAHSTHALIPSATEIREKKARRARLAQESRAQDFIGLSSSSRSASPNGSDDASSSSAASDDGGGVGGFVAAGGGAMERERRRRERRRQGGSSKRLQREDEDMAEGYEELAEDGGVALGRRAERAQRVARRKEMEERIREADVAAGVGAGGEDEEEAADMAVDEDEVARLAAYDAAQTAAGTYGMPGAARRSEEEAAQERRRGPRKMRPIPELGAVVARMREAVREKEGARMGKVRELEELKREQAEIAVEEVRIQEALKEAGQRYEELRKEAGMQSQTNGSGSMDVVMAGRGLESFGSMPMAVDDDSSDE